jgi:cobalamin biosynthesis protein CbiD
LVETIIGGHGEGVWIRLKFLAQKLAEKAVDEATSEAVKAIVSWLRPKQNEKKILDIIITLPDGTKIAVDPPDRSATINIRLANGQIESTTYATPPLAA